MEDKPTGRIGTQLTLSKRPDGKWSIVRRSPSGGESMFTTDFKEAVYYVVEALMKIGREPKSSK